MVTTEMFNIVEEEPLQNYRNYYVYEEAIRNLTSFTINPAKDINSHNIDDHIQAISAILKDGINTEYIETTKYRIDWGDGKWCNLSIIDYWFNLFMWSMLLKVNEQIRPKHIFWNMELKRGNIKDFIDKYILDTDKKKRFGKYVLNEVIEDGTWNYSMVEDFAYYLANTINNEDDIALMQQYPEYAALLNRTYEDVQFNNVKDEGQNTASQVINYIKNSKKLIGYEHGLTNSFKASEAINERQFKEARVNIGTKSIYDTVFPYVIRQSFSNGGVNSPIALFIESSTARTAQVMSKEYVGDSGDMARIMGLNNTDTILNPNPNYICNTRRPIKFTIKSKKHLSMIKNRYYRFNPNGMDHVVNEYDITLLGKTIYLYSPMTCNSMSNNRGICSKCYGDLYYINNDINVGKIAAELLSAMLTQRLLSAKHLLETKIVEIVWNEEFEQYFDIEANAISLSSNLEDVPNLGKYVMLINPDDVCLVSEEEDSVKSDEDAETTIYNEYITKFYIRTPDGQEILFKSESDDNLYITSYLNDRIRRRATNDDGLVNIPLSSIAEDVLFYIKINNNELSKAMMDIMHLINKADVTESMDIDEAMQRLVDLVIDGNLNIDSVHLEVILANQIVAADNMLDKPNWADPGVQYKLLTLNRSLANNQSVIISLLYKDLNRVMYNPLTFAKNKPSFFDLFFMEQPQIYMEDNMYIDHSNTGIQDRDTKVVMCRIVDKTKE